MNGDDIREMKRRRKADVLLGINEHEGTLACLRRRLVATQEKIKTIDIAIERRLNPALMPGYEPSMKDGVLTPLGTTDETIDTAALMAEMEDLLTTYNISFDELGRLHRELQSL